jgi:hypothetical protein
LPAIKICYNLMSRLNFWLMVAMILAGCGSPAASRSIPLPTATALYAQFPPTWTPTPRSGTVGPSPTPAPTRTPAPIATPAAAKVYTSTDALFTLAVPANWSAQSGERQMLSQQTQQMKYAAFGSPGAAPQPAAIIFYGWPAASINSDNAWESAYAVASLAIKVCPMTLTVGGAITLSGEPGKFIGYQDSCGVQGELIGFVHNRVNYGILIEAPQAAWEAWRAPLRELIATLKFK